MSDIFKLPAAEISPKLTPSQLAHEKNIEPSIAINIGNSDAAAVIVMHRFVMFVGVLDGVMLETNLTLAPAIGELKIMERANLFGVVELGFAPIFQPLWKLWCCGEGRNNSD